MDEFIFLFDCLNAMTFLILECQREGDSARDGLLFVGENELYRCGEVTTQRLKNSLRPSSAT